MPLLGDLAASAISALICITIHEVAHGFAAYLLGDPTAKNRGRLSLNPASHIDLFGLIMLVFFQFGWAKPVPVNFGNFKKPKRDAAITSFAGPLSNFILACFFLFLFGLTYTALGAGRATGLSGRLQFILERTAWLSVSLGVFNLLPIPPLDGSKILFSLLPERSYYTVLKYERYGMFLLLLLLQVRAFKSFLVTVVGSIYSSLLGIALFAFNLLN